MENQVKRLLLSEHESDRKLGWLFTKSILGIESDATRVEYCTNVYIEYLWTSVPTDDETTDTYYISRRRYPKHKQLFSLCRNVTPLFTIYWFRHGFKFQESGINFTGFDMKDLDKKLYDLIRDCIQLQLQYN